MEKKSLGDYPIMSELKDEDKWLKFFTVKQLIYFGIALALGIGEIIVFNYIHLIIVGIELLIINVFLAWLLLQNMPNDKFIWGGGTPIKTIALRLVKKNLPSNRVIYTKNYNDTREE